MRAHDAHSAPELRRKPYLSTFGFRKKGVCRGYQLDTANAIPGAKLEIIEGMGHDLPPQLRGRIVDLICDHTGV